MDKVIMDDNINYDVFEKKVICFVSTLGQAKNTICLIKKYNLDAYVYILYTKRNIKVPKMIEQSILHAGVESRLFLLPTDPLIPSPLIVNKIKRQYIKVIKSNNPDIVWVCNRNVHYHLILKYCKKNNVKVGYLEEGLGSYKEEANYEWSLLSSNFKGFNSYLYKLLEVHKENSIIIRVLYWVFREFKEIINFSSTLFRHVEKLFFMSDSWRRLSESFKYRLYSDYFKLEGDFDYSALLFPEKSLINSSVQIPFDFKDGVDKEAIQRYEVSLKGKDTCMFVSQYYGPDFKLFYLEVARQLWQLQLTEVIGSVMIKHHPRETEECRQTFLSLLYSQGVCYTLSDDTSACAEDLIATQHFESIVGVTSSCLIYAKSYCLDINVICIYPSMVIANQKVKELTNIHTDYEVLEKFI